MTHPALLLVDDDRLYRDSLELLLSCSFDVHVADCAEDALALLRRGPCPDVILSDVSMPGIGGAGLLLRLPDALRARIAFITAGIPDPADARLLQQSGRPVLRKPVRFPLLMDTLQRLLDPLQQQQQHDDDAALTA